MNEHMNVRQLIAQAVPGFESLATIDQTKQEFQIPGRTFHTHAISPRQAARPASRPSRFPSRRPARASFA